MAQLRDDVLRVWEWVGAVDMIEAPPSASSNEGGKRRKSGRVSFGGERFIEPSVYDSSTEMSQISKWEEGGQYY